MTVTTIDAITLQQWDEEAHIQYEQTESAFRGTMREETRPAATYNFILLKNSPAQIGKARHSPVVIAPDNDALVPCASQVIGLSKMVDEADLANLSFDIRSRYSTMVADAVNQAYDDIIINALNSAVSNLQEITLPEANTLDINGVATVAEAFNKNNVPQDGRYLALAPGGYFQLTTDTKFNNNFNFMNDVIKTGKTVGGVAYGMDLVRSTRLTTTPGASTIRCFAYHKDAVGVLITKDFTFNVSYQELYRGWLVDGWMKAGAVVIDPKGVFYFDVTA